MRSLGPVLVKMKSYVLLLALLQSLGCSGVPLYNSELESLATRGLGAALAKVNSGDAVSHLYRALRGSVKKVIPMGLNTADLLMAFSIKETECLKVSREDPQTCAFRTGFFVDAKPMQITVCIGTTYWDKPSVSCSSRVRMSATSAQVVTLKCGQDSQSSSSESSEEMFSRGRHQFNIPLANRVPAPPQTPPPVQQGRTLHSQTVEVQPRGDTFFNYLP